MNVTIEVHDEALVGCGCVMLVKGREFDAELGKMSIFDDEVDDIRRLDEEF